MSGNETVIEVHPDWSGLFGPLGMGTLVARRIRGTEVFSFEYDEAWLGRNDNRVLDPDLRPSHGLGTRPLGPFSHAAERDNHREKARA